MKSDMQLMNELAAHSSLIRILSPRESESLKRMLLIMYNDIARVCDDNGLTFMLGGGSCLGAVRHNGFIPWDDDLDINMPRADYEKLILLCRAGALGDKYEIDVPNGETDSKNLFLKIHRKGTLDVEIFSAGSPFPKGVFIDVCPMDFAPKNMFIRKVKALISEVIQVICTSVMCAQYQNSIYHNFMKGSTEAYRRYRQRLIIGRVFGLIPHKKWVYWFDRFNACVKDTGYVTIASGRKHYLGETRRKEIYFPVKYLKFEGIEMPVCADYHSYLTSMYNNYMEIPPVEKREKHFIYEFACNCYE